jgi:acetyl esterase
MTLHPECEAYLKAVARWKDDTGFRHWSEIGAVRAKALFREMKMSRMPPLPPMAVTADHVIQGRAGERRIRILRPEGQVGATLPVALYFHGGGYVLGGIDESEDEARRLAATTPALVISASYRLGPEHPFPAAVDDAYDALLWAAHQAAQYGGDPRRLMVGGTSAGGGLAAAVSRLATTENGPRIALTYLMCPWLDMTLGQHSVMDYAFGYGLERPDLDWYIDCYMGGEGRGDHPLASPVLHPIPPRLPRTVILAAECDPLRDEARLYARKLKEAGIPVGYSLAPGMIHGFNAMTHILPSALPMLAPVEEAMRTV